MPFTDLTTPPTVPTRSMTNDEFIAAADAFVAWMAAFQGDLDTFITELEATAALIEAAPAIADPGLSAMVGLTPAADRLAYFTGVDSSALATFTAFARTLMDDVDAETARATLGLGPLATSSTVDNSDWSGDDLAVANGGTGASTAADARTNLGAAASGANSDITSLAGLTTALSIAQGGTGAATAALALANLLSVTSNANGTAIAFEIGATTYYLQWGSFTAAANTASISRTFPVAFSGSPSVVCNGIGEFDTGVQATQPTVRSVSTTGFTVFNGADASCTTWWIAIGS